MWSGSIIQTGCEITLLHAQFESSTGICNNGAVIGLGVREENNCYTSQLTIQVTPDLDGRTVDCSVDYGPQGGGVTVINTTTLLLSTGAFTVCVSIALSIPNLIIPQCHSRHLLMYDSSMLSQEN